MACGTSGRFGRSQLLDYALGSGSLGLDLEARDKPNKFRAGGPSYSEWPVRTSSDKTKNK